MSLAENLELAWETLEAGRTEEVLVRTLDDLGIASGARVGVDDTGARELLFAIPSDAAVPNPPPVMGVRVLVRTVKGTSRVERFLVIRCDVLGAHRVFARFAADVLEQTARTSDVPKKVLEILSAWRELFRREPLDPESVARGVFGELDELRRLVAIDPSAIEAWRGPANDPQDFVRGRFALEVKSTRTRARFVEIHGLAQLWSSPFDALLLSVKHVATDAGGESIQDVFNSLIDAGIDSDALEAMLNPLGIADPDSSGNRTPLRFRVRDTRYFSVTAASPVLTPDSLAIPMVPSGVSKITYTLALDADGLEAATPELLERVSMGLAGR